MASSSDPLTFSVIIPLEFHRGQAEACVRAWARQTYPRERYEVILAAPAAFPATRLAELQAILTPRDRAITFTDAHDMPLTAGAARAALSEVLFFTESHCRPELDVLAKSADALQSHPEWCGFSCRSVRVTHNRLSVAEADLYEADIAHGMTDHAWRRILDQCFVIRRAPYEAAGGFDATLGHFAEWMLGARLHRLGLVLGYVPNAVVHHHYSGDLREWSVFTRDFTRGEMTALARGDIAECPDLFEPVAEWQERHNWDRSLARQMVRMLAHRLRSWSGRAANTGTGFSEPMRDLVRWAPAALGRARPASYAARLLATVYLARLSVMGRTATRPALKSAFVSALNAIVRAERLRALVDANGAAAERFPPRNAGAWEPVSEHGLPAVGLHWPERWGLHPFVWSAAAAAIELPLTAGTHEIAVQWLPVRPSGHTAAPRFLFRGAPLDSAHDVVRAHSARLRVSTDGTDRAHLAWSCEPFSAPGDSRPLGLPVRRIAWRKIAPPGTTPASPRPVFLLHIRKTAGTSLRDLLVNRFDAARCLLQAHATAHASADWNGYDFVTGHLDIGAASRFALRPVVIAVLREPVDRALSTFYFFRGNDQAFFEQLERELPADAFRARVRFTDLAQQLSLVDLLAQHPDTARPHLDNVLTRALIGNAPNGPLTSNHLAEAKANLQACDVVGLTERLDDTVALVAQTLGWDTAGSPAVFNKTQGRQSVAEEDPNALAVLAEWNHMDRELYSFGADLVERRVQALRSQPVETMDAGRLRAGVLPNARAFSFDQPIHGLGWHTRERHFETWMCWTGREATAWIDLSLDDPAPSFLSCRVRAAISADALDGARVRVNGQAIDIVRRYDGNSMFLEGNVTPDLLYRYPDRVRIEFDVPGTRCPHDLDPENPDRRPLGIALDAIRLVPTHVQAHSR